MSRSRKVDPQAAMDGAMALFWAQGYCNLGTRQIEEETGITRFTLQTSYGGKMNLFLTALDHYLDIFESSGLLQNVEGDLEGIARFFEMRGDSEQMPETACQGCFMLNSMIEFADKSPEVILRADRYFGLLRAGIGAGLERSRNSGDLDVAFDVPQMTEVLLSAALGLNAVIRASTDPATGQTMAAAIAALVRGWAVAQP